MKSAHCIALLILLLSLYPIKGTAEQLDNPGVSAKVESAKNKLDDIQKNIDREKIEYAKRLETQDRKTRLLEKEIKKIQSAADNQLISLEKLQSDLKLWEDQHYYQRNLLINFHQYYQESTDEPDQNTTLATFSGALDDIRNNLSPRWQEQTITSIGGKNISADVLDLGVHRYFISNEESGFLQGQKPPFRAHYLFSGDDHQATINLQTTGHTTLKIDPSQGRAVELELAEESVLAHLEKGGVWIIPILGFGAIALIIALGKAVQLVRLPKLSEKTMNNIETLLGDNTERSKKLLRSLSGEMENVYYDLLRIVLDQPASTSRDDLLINRIHKERRTCEKFLTIITVTAAVSPLLGLLGTVSGMIETFKMLSIFGNSDPVAISGGISEALVTTELGLIVAIPALVTGALLSRRVKSHLHQVEETAIAMNAKSAA
ncbi:MotA/TolQ/ExbB proton channel family protein [Gilvimarinus sp. SDUM040013]|uniref:MotA/TolQ/ExbB proton channel family protein n=1 Tax=Gilvimarinus gilvus TaxID=3058038 RepID=A0ABU4RUG3_9GAMM|nr:MotA/TolQ/ExbB proton channel family protein [Gilvimarinus sp. SDUM040013]MDO3388609.1 MotA/TolQ/ExbB proton channel family protein [Gilvimarinus sp. SDUM040013]MDX6848519.1 MotA/TolQ/ExbB proton channel family protein [Gilvimarinus sp. SDUM040013]